MANTNIDDILKVLTRGRKICECPHCQRSRAITAIAKKLPEEDAQQLLSIYDSIIDAEEESDMKIAYLESTISSLLL